MNSKSNRFHVNKVFIRITGIAVVICIISICIFMATCRSRIKLNSFLNTGSKYLSELNYEQAIVSYQAAITIDPKCEEAYLGLADAYMALENFDKALEVLAEGYIHTSSELISAKTEEIKVILTQIMESESKLSMAGSDEQENMTATEPETEPSEEAVSEPENIQEDNIPEADEWGESLYAMLLKDDCEGVIRHLGDISNIRENCAEYEYSEWALWDYETAYRMKAADGQVFGIIVYEYDNGKTEIDAFVSYTDGDGFEYIGRGDHYVTVFWDGSCAYIKDGTEHISDSSFVSSYTIEEDMAVAVWHM